MHKIIIWLTCDCLVLLVNVFVPANKVVVVVVAVVGWWWWCVCVCVCVWGGGGGGGGGGHFRNGRVCPLACLSYFVVSVLFLTNRLQVWFKFGEYIHYALWTSPSLINFWGRTPLNLGMGVCVHWPVCHTLWFPYFFWQIAYKFDSNLVNTYIMHYGPPPAWLTFGGVLHWISNVFWSLIGWAVSAHFQTNRWSYLGQIWRTNSFWASSCLISYAPLIFCSFLASDWFSSFQTFADKPLIGLGSNLVGQLTMGLPSMPD